MAGFLRSTGRRRKPLAVRREFPMEPTLANWRRLSQAQQRGADREANAPKFYLKSAGNFRGVRARAVSGSIALLRAVIVDAGPPINPVTLPIPNRARRAQGCRSGNGNYGC
jgi:hypothetical protein